MARRASLGQHFLRDRAAVARIVAALDVRPGAAVLEIGPGQGALTAPLIEAAGRIAAVEIDPALAAALRRKYDASRLLLIEGDILRVGLDEVAQRLGAGPDGRLHIAGNLPYAISKPIAFKLVRECGAIERAVLMFQREVAERLGAAPGSRRYAPLSVLVQLAFEVRTLCDLKPQAFRPPPQVDSRVSLWSPRPAAGLGAAIEARLRTCLAASFRARRRTLRNNLRAALGDERTVEALLAATAIDGGLRAEQVAPGDFVRLAEAWPHAPAEAAPPL